MPQRLREVNDKVFKKFPVLNITHEGFNLLKFHVAELGEALEDLMSRSDYIKAITSWNVLSSSNDTQSMLKLSTFATNLHEIYRLI